MKVLKYVICLLALGMLTVSPAAFSGAGSGAINPGQGDQNRNHTGHDGPDSTTLSCLSAIASKNPVLMLEACGNETIWNHKLRNKGIGGGPMDAVIQGTGPVVRPGQGEQHQKHTGG